MRCLRQHRNLLLDTEPAPPFHAPQYLGNRVRHRSCVIASSSSKPASRILTPPTARRPSPQGYGLSLREAAVLQSFPDDYVFFPDDEIEPIARMIGNAVPPKLAEFFAGYLVNSLALPEKAARRSASS